MLRVVRLISRTFRCASSSAMFLLTAAADSPSCRAAPAKLPAAAVVRKTLRAVRWSMGRRSIDDCQ
ncbi:hypothetical protein D9M68_324140 [compost metagenome]